MLPCLLMQPKSIPTNGPVNSKTDPCWICDEQIQLVEHHMIPRAYGGVNGPTVYICSNCHKNVHAIESEIGSEPFQPDDVLEMIKDKLFYIPETHLTRAFICIKMIIQARDAVEGDPNKSVVFMDRFPPVVKNQLRALRTVYPKLNQQKIVRLAIELLYSRHFPNNKK